MRGSCWQWCANGCNNSQQCWDLQCIVGRIQAISLCNPCVQSVRGHNNVGRAVSNGSNIVAVLSGDHGTKEMLGVVVPVCTQPKTYSNTLFQNHHKMYHSCHKFVFMLNAPQQLVFMLKFLRIMQM